jgi:small subunit ribosomal protein S19
MARSIKKGPYIDDKLYKRVKEAVQNNINTPIRTYSRASTIIPEMIGKTISVHNGNRFIPVKVTENIIGHKLGEFAPTRLFRAHGGDKRMR